SPRECKTIQIDPTKLKYKVFMCHKSKSELKGTNALKYIKWGENKGFNNRPSTKSNKPWFSLSDYSSPMLWWVNLGDRYICFNNYNNLFSDKMFYNLYPLNNLIEKFIVSLNCLLTRLCSEIWGQELTGNLTFLTHTVEMCRRIEVINPEKLELNINFDMNREIGNLFYECGFDKEIPVREQEPDPLPDRKVLDDIVFDALGLTEQERKEVYWAVCELVQNRLNKAKSV
ncbi:MAG: hypothetical protein P9L95_00890, partial [Candidatus Tenebribacter mawsonii]|nr:hypothetical protein [Candidatus Tenebribacter mawsonii]